MLFIAIWSFNSICPMYMYHINMVCSMFRITELGVSSQLRNYMLKIFEWFCVADETHKPKIKAIKSNYINVLLIRIVQIFSHCSTLYPLCRDQDLCKVQNFISFEFKCTSKYFWTRFFYLVNFCCLVLIRRF